MRRHRQIDPSSNQTKGLDRESSMDPKKKEQKASTATTITRPHPKLPHSEQSSNKIRKKKHSMLAAATMHQ